MSLPWEHRLTYLFTRMDDWPYMHVIRKCARLGEDTSRLSK